MRVFVNEPHDTLKFYYITYLKGKRERERRDTCQSSITGLLLGVLNSWGWPRMMLTAWSSSWFLWKTRTWAIICQLQECTLAGRRIGSTLIEYELAGSWECRWDSNPGTVIWETVVSSSNLRHCSARLPRPHTLGSSHITFSLSPLKWKITACTLPIVSV